jgi:hypothetical protein
MIDVPLTIFPTPTAEDLKENETYWQGFDAGKAMRSAVPGPEPLDSYESYRQTKIYPLLKPALIHFTVQNEAVGFNEAVLIVANYRWVNEPNSPHNKVY